MSLKPTIDYTNKDYASLRQAMLDLARYRMPEWTDQSPADLGILLVDLFAYMGDIILYYQDRIASEFFAATASERRNVQDLLRLIGYELQPPAAASADLNLIFKPPPLGASVVTIPQGAQFATPVQGGSTQIFEYLDANLDIDLNSAQVQPLGDGSGKLVYVGLPVRQGQPVVGEVIGSSTGEPNQSFSLAQSPLILETLLVEVDEGAGWVAWERRENLLYYIASDGSVTLSGPDSRDYYVQYDENDVAWVLFGDGVYGRVPPIGSNNIRATYHAGGSSAGNVPAGTITDSKTPVNNSLLNANTKNLLDSVTNPLPAAGGADHESLEHAVRFAPLAFRSGQRAVTLNDHVALAYQVGGVAKVRARSRAWNQIDLYIAPEGDSCRPVPEDLKKRILAYFEDRRMVGAQINVQDPSCVPIWISMDVVLDRHYRPDAVRQSIETAVQNFLAYARVDFGQTLYLSDVYAAVETLPGVSALTVTRFRRMDRLGLNLADQLQTLGIGPLTNLPPALQKALTIDVETSGRIDSGEFEIPTLGQMDVNLQEGP